MSREVEKIEIPVPDQDEALWWLETQFYLGRMVTFFVIVKRGPMLLIYARIEQGPFNLDRLYTFSP
jgi:hypothetical protein